MNCGCGGSNLILQDLEVVDAFTVREQESRALDNWCTLIKLCVLSVEWVGRCSAKSVDSQGVNYGARLRGKRGVQMNTAGHQVSQVETNSLHQLRL